MPEELISINEYKKRFHVGDIKVKQMILHGELRTKGKKIVVSKDFIPMSVYEETIRENEQLRNKLEMIKKII